MYNAKYVIIDGRAIIFSTAIQHKDMVGYNEKAQGAGFVSFGLKVDGEGGTIIAANAYGESVSLGIKSREEDSEILTRQITSPY